MAGLRGALAGALGLAGLQVLLSNERAYGTGLDSFFGFAAHAADSFLSPGVAAIPDRRQPATVQPATVSAQGAATAALPAAGMPTAAAAQGVVNAAMSVLGAPYVFGAQGPNAFDCSGLVTFAYRAIGIDLVPSSFSQADDGVGIPVGPQFVHPGDLVFTPGMTPKRSLGHVGIALSANTWITAPHTGAFVHVSTIPWDQVERVRRLL